MDDVEIVIPTVEELSCQPKKDVPCPEDECRMVFKTLSALHMHVVQTHGSVQEGQSNNIYGRGRKQKRKVKLFYCPVKDCPRGLVKKNPFHRRTSLRQHYFVCHGEKSFICSKCERGFGTAATLKRHENVCGQFFQCTCKCPFKSRESLLMHAKRRGHTLPGQYQNIELTKKEKMKKTNPQPSVNYLPNCAKIQIPRSSQNPKFILPKPKIMSASQAAMLHPENTTLVTVTDGVITDIKELIPVQTSQRPNMAQTVKINVKDVFHGKPSSTRPNLSDAQAQWSATDTADSRQDNATNTHLEEHVADQQVQVLPEMLTVGTNFPGLAETDAHTQTNLQTSSSDGNSVLSDAQIRVMDIGNSMTDALVQTMPSFRLGTLAPDQASGQNMETQTSSDLLLQAMMSAMLQRPDCSQPPVVISGFNPLSENHVLGEGSDRRNIGETLTVHHTSSQSMVQPCSGASSQPQKEILVTSINHGITNQQYSNVPISTQRINMQTDQRPLDDMIQTHGSSTKLNRKRSLPNASSGTKSSNNTQTTLITEHTNTLQDGRKELNLRLSRESSQLSPQKNVPTSKDSTEQSYLRCISLENSSSAENHQHMEASSAEKTTIGIQAENNLNKNNEHNTFSTLDLMDPFPDFGDVFLESIATQTSEENLSAFDSFMNSSQRDLATPNISEADTWTATSLHKSFMGESFEDLLYTDSGSQTDEFQEFMFENQLSVKNIVTCYDSDDNEHNDSTTEKHLEAAGALDEVSVVEQMEVNKNGNGVVSSNVSASAGLTPDTTANTLVNPDGNSDGMCSSSSEHLTIERDEEASVGFSDVETQADIYPLKRSRLSAVMSNNETQTKCNSVTASIKVNPPDSFVAKPGAVSLTTSEIQPTIISDSTPASKKRMVDSSQNAEYPSPNNQNTEAPKYCNAEIQADIIVINRSKEEVMPNSETISVETQTKHQKSNTDTNIDINHTT